MNVLVRNVIEFYRSDVQYTRILKNKEGATFL